MTPLRESPYSYHFTVLWYLGSWLYETKSSLKLNLYVGYRLLITTTELIGLCGLLQDFYFGLGDIKKMTWNLSCTSLLFGTIVKNFQMMQNNETINRLRWMLHQDAESRQEPEDLSIHESALKELRLLRISFYGTAAVFIPTWFLSRYSGFFWGAKELPIPIHLPKIINLEDDFQFHCTYFALGFFAIIGMVFAMETELAMYGILIQISREYRILLKDIFKINALYEDVKTITPENQEALMVTREVNPSLKTIKTKMLLKALSRRQKRLIQYTEAFESCFNKPLLQEFFGMSILIVGLSLQCLWETVDFSGNLLYQIGYLFINVVDMYLICMFSTRLRNQCFQVGEAIYSVLWYRMGTKIQKDIAMIIMRSQHPPKLTIGKFMDLGLNTFMSVVARHTTMERVFRGSTVEAQDKNEVQEVFGTTKSVLTTGGGKVGMGCIGLCSIMGHLYSWLTLFRQVEVKNTSK